MLMRIYCIFKGTFGRLPQLRSGLLLLVAGPGRVAIAGAAMLVAGGYDASYGLVAAIWPGSSPCLVAIGWGGWPAEAARVRGQAD